ncbi:MAG: penicillin acylase family protein [Gammaproteobacteria bacterium]
MWKWLRRGLVFLFIALLLSAGVIYHGLRGSLAQLDGEAGLPGLEAAVEIERDAQGVPTLSAGNRLDLARATGYLHAQERYFQMDLTRRGAAGELSELIGPATLERDRKVRLHRMRSRAAATLALASAEERALLGAYAEGVNAGLQALDAVPFEYRLLGATPRPWAPEDSFLCVAAMWFMLTDEDASRDAALGLMADLWPAPLVDFMMPPGTVWDAPLQGGAAAPVAIPGPELYDLRLLPPDETAPPQAAAETEFSHSFGSNNWAVDGSRTGGGALVAGDMHLGLGVPNTWYRARLRLDGMPGLDVTGVTLPGSPFVVAGSNRRIAWSFTNSYGDYSDRILVEPDPDNAGHYLTPEGHETFEEHPEQIRVRGEPAQTLTVRETRWGPVIGRDHYGRLHAVRWLAHAPQATNLRLAWLEQAHSVAEALAVANLSGLPPQNLVVGDADGAIGWTLAGRLPAQPAQARPVRGSEALDDPGWLPAEAYPRVVAPAEGLIWTANTRVVDGADLLQLGDGGYDLGARAQQIRDRLRAQPGATPADMLALQLDDRALLLVSWQALLSETLQGLPPTPALQEAAARVADWGGRAAVDSVGYRLVREFRTALSDRVLHMLTAELRRRDPQLNLRVFRQFEGPLWQLLREQPRHLLSPRYTSWKALLEETATTLVEDLARQPGGLAARSWGEQNTVRVQHPLSRAIPLLGRWLDMPPQALPGDHHLPRVQDVAFGASQRFAVTPGVEAAGYFHMPAGQSGHPLSPHYRSGHQDWAQGRATPFLPGQTQHRLRLVPG